MPVEINIDASAAVSLVAEGSPVRHALKAAVAGKVMVMCTTAEQEFLRIVALFGGPLEKARASRFLARVRVVPDSPSARAAALKPTNNLQRNDIVILGTGDALGAVTLTADRRAVSAAQSQGVNFQVSLHAPVILTGH